MEAATAVFIAQGYERAQMEDVAKAFGVAKGTLYGYVESKAALFDLVLRCADGHAPLPDVSALPLAAPDPTATLAAVRARLDSETGKLELLAALSRSAPVEVEAELAAIISDLFRRMSRNKRSIKLLDRCAEDQPELADVWFERGRAAQHAALVSYLDRRIGEGALARIPNTSVAARALLEAIAFWAVHRHWDPSPQTVDEDDVEATLVALALHGLAGPSA
jgi:AcrR family transcriptional regulator